MQETKSERIFDVVLFGDTGVGKTSFVNSWATGQFSANPLPEPGIVEVTTNYQTFKVRIHDNAVLNITESYYGGIIMFDTGLRKSHKSCDIYHEVASGICDNVVIYGNKTDTPNQTPSPNEMAGYYKNKNIACMEGSAKTGIGLNLLFMVLFSPIMKSGEVIIRKKVLQKEDLEQKPTLQIEEIVEKDNKNRLYIFTRDRADTFSVEAKNHEECTKKLLDNFENMKAFFISVTTKSGIHIETTKVAYEKLFEDYGYDHLFRLISQKSPLVTGAWSFDIVYPKNRF